MVFALWFLVLGSVLTVYIWLPALSLVQILMQWLLFHFLLAVRYLFGVAKDQNWLGADAKYQFILMNLENWG
jgi:hypothetical protein